MKKVLIMMIVWTVIAVVATMAMLNTFVLLLGTIATTKPVETMPGAEIAARIAIDVLCSIIIGVLAYAAHKLQKGGSKK